jgi:hypothetical protein
MPELHTTNVLLGVMAAVSLLEGLVIIGAGVAGFVAYRKVTGLIDRGFALADGIEARQVAPAMDRVNAILDDVKDVTERVKDETVRAERVLHTTIDRLDNTATRVRSNVRTRASTIVGVIRGARTVLEHMLRT